MLDTPLRIGIIGTSPIAQGVALQVAATDGMDLAWRCETSLHEIRNLFKNEPIDVFVEASGDLNLAADSSLLAISHNAHLILTNPLVDVAIGLKLQAEAYERGIIITSDAGTPHGTLASMIQEAHIMGFDTVQAGQICPTNPSPKLQYEMAALANGFGFLPPEGGMTGPEIDTPDQIIPAFDLESYQDFPKVDFVRSSTAKQGLYLIIKPKKPLNPEQIAHLKNQQFPQVGDKPYFLLRRDLPLGYFETPKAILAASAGQPILTPGYPSCEVYADSDGHPILLPYTDELVPHYLLPQNSPPKDSPTLENTTLPDSPLTHLWVEQRKIIESQTQS